MLRGPFVLLGMGLAGLLLPPLDTRPHPEAGAAWQVSGARMECPDRGTAADIVIRKPECPVLHPTGISDRGVELLKAEEGFVATPRWDSTQWSVGYGTRADHPHQTITAAEADVLLRQRVASISRNIIAKSRTRLTQDHVDALTSLAYNVGEAALLGHGKRAPSTLWVKLQANDFDGAAAEFGRWNKVRGKTVPGLTKRRQREAELFRRGGA